VCYFGAYDRNYIRVNVLIEGLRDNGVHVIECNARKFRKWFRIPVLVWKFIRNGLDADVLLVNEAGQKYMPLAKILGVFTRKPVILDAFLSLYHVAVIDCGTVPAGSIRARILYLLDRVACLLADKVLLDTEEHIDYFCREFNLNRTKFHSIPIGADEKKFGPWVDQVPNPSDTLFRVVYVGTFWPLQGVETIIEAAELLRAYPDICFDLYGDGPMRRVAEERAKKSGLSNCVFHGWITPEAVPSVLARASVCLGHFGRTMQANMVIPGKVYEALAMGKPVITGDTPAIRRYLNHLEHAYLVPPGNPQALADAILYLKANEEIRQRIGANGLRHFQRTATRSYIGARVRAICEELLASRGIYQRLDKANGL
jgi:glycosyltransferase involved in cell wall biosynthesis